MSSTVASMERPAQREGRAAERWRQDDTLVQGGRGTITWKGLERSGSRVHVSLPRFS